MSQPKETGDHDRQRLDYESVDYGETLVEVEDLTKHFLNSHGIFGGLQVDLNGGGFPITRSSERVQAVDDVSFEIKRGETLGLVGESGCGKSTLARTIIRLIEPTDGRVYFRGKDLANMEKDILRSTRKDIQMIFQDPQSSLNPRMKVGPIVEEPMKAHSMYDEEQREEITRELLSKVGLDPGHYNRYPHEFSGGQRQRINLARALSVNPDFIVCDEPTSALDASIQAQVLNTMAELQREFGLTYLFISHDLSVIRHISDRVAVMYLGNLVELAETKELFENPQHPYTESLINSIPVPDPSVQRDRSNLVGEVPSPIDPPSGCRFHTRCPVVIAPEEYDFEGSRWEDIRQFIHAVDVQSFAPANQRRVVREFFPNGLPDGEPGMVIEEAIHHILEEEWDDAEMLLKSTFTERSICATQEPAYEVESKYGSGPHIAACHLNRD